MIEAKTLHEPVMEGMRRVKTVDELEIKKKLKKHELLKNRISSSVVVEDPQAVLDEIRRDIGMKLSFDANIFIYAYITNHCKDKMERDR